MNNKLSTAQLNGHRQILLPKTLWGSRSAEIILNCIRTVLKQKKGCSIGLTGGQSAATLYAALGQSFEFKTMSDLEFYLTDERCVPLNHPDSNYKLVMETLFCNQPYLKQKFYNINTCANSNANTAEIYNNLFPTALDILILTIGDDGHIASIFPEHMAQTSKNKIAFHQFTKGNNHNRITITPNVIKSAKNIFVLAPTDKKKAILDKILIAYSDNNYALPGALAIRGTWLLSI